MTKIYTQCNIASKLVFNSILYCVQSSRRLLVFVLLLLLLLLLFSKESDNENSKQVVAVEVQLLAVEIVSGKQSYFVPISIYIWLVVYLSAFIRQNIFVEISNT